MRNARKRTAIRLQAVYFSRNVFASLFADELPWANQRKERKKGTPIIVWLPAYKRGFAPVETQILFSYYWQNFLIGFPAYCLLICLATAQHRHPRPCAAVTANAWLPSGSPACQKSPSVTFSPSCFQNCKIEFCSIILQFCRCGGWLNAKGHPDGFLVL